MTIADKQKTAVFVDLAFDYLSSGYKSEPKEYNFEEYQAPELTAATSIKEDTLEQIYSEITTCKNCILGNTRKNAVPGEGVSNPLVMVIGEGPGADEDRLGRPFVGKAGQLLDKMLSSINLSRTTNCYIANVVKCRPPDNRDPNHIEASACKQFLQRQIIILKPKIILLVGNVALQNLLDPKAKVTSIRGKFMEYKTGDLTFPLLVTYHPSALLHNEDYKRPAWEDLKLLKSKIDSL